MWGQIASAVVGGYMSQQAAKKQAAAMDRANAASNQGYTDARPYITDVYNRGQSALDGILSQGAYTGQTYAPMNDMQSNALGSQYTFNEDGLADAQGFQNVGQGFANNYANLYNQASQDMLGSAINYASDSANYQPLLNAAMMDDRRNLDENVLRGIDMGASASNNTNSSRAAVANAIAERGFSDRRDQALANIQNNLIDRSINAQQQQLNNQVTANQNLAGLYNLGFDQGSAALSNMSAAGSAFRQEDQNQMTDAMANYQRQRDFEMDQLNAYNAGILGQAPRTAVTQQPNLVDPTMAGVAGTMTGFGIGRQIDDYFKQPTTKTNTAYRPMYEYGAAGGRNYGVNNNIYGF